MRIDTLTPSYLSDWAVGDPEFLPHPVRFIGNVIEIGDRALLQPQARSATQFIRGALLTGAIGGGSAYAASKLLRLLERVSSSGVQAAEIWLGASCLATRNLLDEAGAVVNALERSDLETARRRLSRILGRETGALDVSGISHAVIETLAESLCDGVIARLMSLAMAGVPLAMAYKDVNTLD